MRRRRSWPRPTIAASSGSTGCCPATTSSSHCRRPVGSGEIGAPSAASIDSALRSLARGRATGPASLATASTPTVAAAAPVGFAPVYFPGTPNYREAARVHVDTGEERVRRRLRTAARSVAAIDGVVRGDVPNLATVQVTLIPIGPRVATGMSSNSLAGPARIDAQGTFRYANLPPGSYRLVARPCAAVRDPSGADADGHGGVAVAAAAAARPPPGAPSGRPRRLATFSTALPTSRCAATTSRASRLTLQPGGTIAGRVVFAGSGAARSRKRSPSSAHRSRSKAPGGMVSSNGLMMGNSLISNAPPAVASRRHVRDPRHRSRPLHVQRRLPTRCRRRRWKLRSAIGGDRDLLDDPLDLGPGVDLRDVVVTFTDARDGNLRHAPDRRRRSSRRSTTSSRCQRIARCGGRARAACCPCARPRTGGSSSPICRRASTSSRR